MPWALATLALVGFGAVYLLATVRAIHHARHEDTHYRLSVRFWGALALLGVAIVGMLIPPLLQEGRLGTDVGRLTLVLMSVLPSTVIFVGTRNAMHLWRARSRRKRALEHGIAVEGHVVERLRWFLAQDLMALVVDLEVPDPIPGNEITYRQRQPQPMVRRRVIETCPGDHWARFGPGSKVKLKVLPDDPASFAVLFFADPGPALPASDCAHIP